VQGVCPVCASPVLVEKYTRTKGKHVGCPQKGCRFVSKDKEDEKEPL
jgi:DNA topoisomerase-1